MRFSVAGGSGQCEAGADRRRCRSIHSRCSLTKALTRCGEVRGGTTISTPPWRNTRTLSRRARALWRTDQLCSLCSASHSDSCCSTAPRSSMACASKIRRSRAVRIKVARMQWIDIGANLTHDSFDCDRDAVIERARAHGVVQMIVTGADLASSHAAVRAGAAIPAHAVRDRGRASASRRAACGAGSAGTACTAARSRRWSPSANAVSTTTAICRRAHAQRRAFEWQLQLAAECGKPVFLHQRDAHADFLAVLRAARPRSAARRRALLHRRGARSSRTIWQLGLSIGITGWFCDERRGAHLQRCVGASRRIGCCSRPMRRTCCRATCARRRRSRRNEPMYLPHIGAAVARARGEIARALRRAYQRACACPVRTDGHVLTVTSR